MTYARAFADVLPWVVDLSEMDALMIMTELSKATEKFPGGTSFAVTSENGTGRRRMYMSECSYERYKDLISAGEPTVDVIEDVKEGNTFAFTKTSPPCTCSQLPHVVNCKYRFWLYANGRGDMWSPIP